MHKILYLPAEHFPTQHSLMNELYAGEDEAYQTVFLMRTYGIDLSIRRWKKAGLYLMPYRSRFKLINKIGTYFCIDLRYLIMVPLIVFKEKIDIIQVRDMTFPLVVSLILKLFGKKVVYQKSHPHEHMKMNEDHAKRLPIKYPQLYRNSRILENRVLHWLLNFCDLIFPITSYMADNLHRDYGLSREKMVPMGLGFYFEREPIGTLRKLQPEEKARCVYVGTLAKEREFNVLIAGLAQASMQLGPSAFLVEFIGGTEVEIASLKQLASELGISVQCRFLGRIDRAKVYEHIRASHVGISWFGRHIRFSDASPTKMIEYMALGLPVIATDSVYEHGDVLQKTGAGLICRVDQDDFAEKLVCLIEGYDEFAEKAIEALPYVKERYSYKKMKVKIFETYRRLCGNRENK